MWLAALPCLALRAVRCARSHPAPHPAPQAPWQFVLGPQLDNPCKPLSGTDPLPPYSRPGSCTLPELLGFCKLRGHSGSSVGSCAGGGGSGGSHCWGGAHGSGGFLGGAGLEGGGGGVAAALLASPAAADLVLWVLLRVHAKLLAVPVYRQVGARVCTPPHAWAAPQCPSQPRGARCWGLQLASRARGQAGPGCRRVHGLCALLCALSMICAVLCA